MLHRGPKSSSESLRRVPRPAGLSPAAPREVLLISERLPFCRGHKEYLRMQEHVCHEGNVFEHAVPEAMMHRSAAAGQPPMQLDTIPCEGEWTMHFHLGRVFISHTAADKPFVRRLAARLEKSHFQVWLDEHNLIAGDPLPESIG